MSTHLFGIRHHGPGSARSLRAALAALQPDCILLEGPPEAEPLLHFVTHPDLVPPVALLLYVPDAPRNAVCYPFAAFSPEWQALCYALEQGSTLRFTDLPQVHWLALRQSAAEGDAPAAETEDAGGRRRDPLTWVAEAAGYSDSELWWEHLVEERRDSLDLFQAVQELMTALRADLAEPADLLEAKRESWMRLTLRQAQRDGFQRIAVVCGAWHVPALASLPPLREDQARVKGLPKVKVAAAWVPWSYSRLTAASGYGAGISAPGWYHHLWHSPDAIALHWLTTVAWTLRAHDLDASPAQVIDAVRLADTLAALRERPRPGLAELQEAAHVVLCRSQDAPLQLIANELLLGERLGQVPEEAPQLPLQRDLERLQKQLRLPPKAIPQQIDLDLREPQPLLRSLMLHRLTILEIPWGRREAVRGAKGSFHELWTLAWLPDFAVQIIAVSIWGNTVATAAAAYAGHKARQAQTLPELTVLIDQVLWADLPEVVAVLVTRLQALAAAASDIQHLLAALPPLAQTLRYGNVRGTDAGALAEVVDGLVVRICLGLPGAAQGINEDAARPLFGQLIEVAAALQRLQNEEHLRLWTEMLLRLADGDRVHGLLSGRAARLLLEQGRWTAAEVALRLQRVCGHPVAPLDSAFWLEGLLQGSGLLLLHDDGLWRLLDDWLGELPAEAFEQALPLLRRTFAGFPAGERQRLGERAAGGRIALRTVAGAEISAERATRVLPVLGQILGMASPSQPEGTGGR